MTRLNLIWSALYFVNISGKYVPTATMTYSFGSGSYVISLCLVVLFFVQVTDMDQPPFVYNIHIAY